MSSTVLVINSGSSSLKFQLVEPVAGMSRAAGIVERIGERSSPVADHAQALHRAFKMLAEDGIDLQTCGLVAVGHRVVHGGTEFHQPTLLDDTVIGKLEELSALAPLHNPPAVLGIKVARRLLANVAHVAVFERPFSMTCPRRPRPMPSTATSPTDGISAATDFMALHTNTSASGPPPSWAARSTV